MVKVKGVNIYPGQIEDVLRDIEGVSSEYQVMMAAALMTVVPVLIVYSIYEKQLVKSITLTGIK